MELAAAGARLSLKKGESVFLPAGMGRYQVIGQADFILSEV
jgi:mannose-6-phosphate isomerase